MNALPWRSLRVFCGLRSASSPPSRRGPPTAATPSAPATPTTSPARPAPKVLWVHPEPRTTSSPRRLPAGDRVFFTGLGAFNVSTFYCFATDPKAEPAQSSGPRRRRILKLPSVSSPAVVGDKLIFGDGMHQTDGAILHCLQPGHRPAAVAIARARQAGPPGRLADRRGRQGLLGGGAAGVLCVDLNRVTLEGKEMDLPAIQKILDQKWAELQAKYEEDKKKDSEFAVPPTEDSCPSRPRSCCGSRARTSGTSMPRWRWSATACWWRRPSSTRKSWATAPCSAWTPGPATSCGGRR